MPKKQPFRNLDTEWAKAFNKGDAAGVVALYTADVQFLGPNGPILKGRKKLKELTESNYQAGWRNIKFSNQQGVADGNLAYNMGHLTVDIPTGDGMRKEKGKFVDIYRRQTDGSWKIALTIYNSDLPEHGQQSARKSDSIVSKTSVSGRGL